MTKAERKKFDKMLAELDRLKAEMDEENERANAVMDVTSAFLTDVACKHYPQLGEMESASIEELGELISRTAWDFSNRLSEIEDKGNKEFRKQKK